MLLLQPTEQLHDLEPGTEDELLPRSALPGRRREVHGSHVWDQEGEPVGVRFPPHTLSASWAPGPATHREVGARQRRKRAAQGTRPSVHQCAGGDLRQWGGQGPPGRGSYTESSSIRASFPGGSEAKNPPAKEET